MDSHEQNIYYPPKPKKKKPKERHRQVREIFTFFSEKLGHDENRKRKVDKVLTETKLIF